VTANGGKLPVESPKCHRVLSTQVADAANYILQGDLTGEGTAPAPIPYQDRGDEVGELARALRAWQDVAAEREVLSLISEGCSNKQGALRMNISPRTFESHRAEAMRKLGARNTADLVRKALLQPA